VPTTITVIVGRVSFAAASGEDAVPGEI